MRMDKLLNLTSSGIWAFPCQQASSSTWLDRASLASCQSKKGSSSFLFTFADYFNSMQKCISKRLSNYHPQWNGHQSHIMHCSKNCSVVCRCLPACLGGHDVIAQAEPGSGKTLGYLLPAAAHLESHVHDAASKLEGPLVLILVPTRELALQVATVCRTFHRELGFQTQAIIGGIDKDQQVI